MQTLAMPPHGTGTQNRTRRNQRVEPYQGAEMTFNPNKFDKAHYEAQRWAERTCKQGRFNIELRTLQKMSAFVVYSTSPLEWGLFWVRKLGDDQTGGDTRRHGL
jgi:hypothetical protein